MLCSDTGKTETVHLPHLKLDVAREIDGTIGAIANHEHGEGHVLMKIIRGGGVSAIETMIRKFRTPKKKAS